jgi:hypothetical protein
MDETEETAHVDSPTDSFVSDCSAKKKLILISDVDESED